MQRVVMALDPPDDLVALLLGHVTRVGSLFFADVQSHGDVENLPAAVLVIVVLSHVHDTRMCSSIGVPVC